MISLLKKGVIMGTKRCVVGVLALSGLFFAAINPTTSQDSKYATGDKPKVNFFGTLKDNSGHQFEVENILISGMYRQIPVYVKPSRDDADPAEFRSYLDLDEVFEITVPDPVEPQICKFKGRDYVEIIVISDKDRKIRTNFIVEGHKRINFDRKNPAGPIESDIAFKGLGSLVIKGHHDKDDAPVRSGSVSSVKAPESSRTSTGSVGQEQTSDFVSGDTARIVVELENEVDDSSIGKKIKRRLQDLLADLKRNLGIS